MTRSRKIALIGTGFASYGAMRCFQDEESLLIDVFDIGLTSRQPSQTDLPVPNGKTCQGSYFCYGINDPRWNVRLISERLCSSHALGGHSTVYSGSVLYPKVHDLADWPEVGRPGATDYDAVLRSMTVLQEQDELAPLFPPVPSEADLQDPRPDGEIAVLGLSRLAIEPPPGGEGTCRPFQTGSLFAELHRQGKITYRAGCYVVRLRRLDQGVEVVYQREDDDEESNEPYDAVFLGAGCINTTGIVDRSLFGEGTRDYHLGSTTLQILAFARLSLRPIARSLSRNSADLPEFFIEVNGRPTRGTWSHTQLSAINDQIIGAICLATPKILHPVIRLARRLVYFGLCTTHSHAAETIRIRCTTEEAPDGRRHTMRIEEPPGTAAPRGVARLLKAAVLRHWKELRMVPIPGGGALADHFRGNKLGGWHVGGSIPMSDRGTDHPSCLPSGEVHGLRGVFVLDSAAFPSIPASTIALLSAANGHRVARLWRESESHHQKD
jgi:choline dehydrogenase-like flavoprotein